jgi:hypothetical protein
MTAIKRNMNRARSKPRFTFHQRVRSVWASALLQVSLLLLLGAGARADQYGDFTYATNLNNTATITDYTGSGGAVTIPGAVNSMPVAAIGDYAFDGYAGLASITIPNSVASIGFGAFASCTGLTNVTILDGVTTIGPYAFLNCTSLAGITMGSNVTSIGSDAFNQCSSLSSITIGASVTNIGSDVFVDCGSLGAIAVSEPSLFYRSEDGVLFDRDMTVLISYPGARAGNYTVPAGVASIEDGAFSGCRRMSGVTLPDSLAVIGNEAFENCPGLNNIVIPNGVTNIGFKAFAYCFNLTGVTLGDRVANIGSWAFFICGRLTNLAFPNSLTNIAGWAFYGCGRITSVTLPASVTSIGPQAFGYCTGLTSITLPTNTLSIGYEEFSDCTALTSISIPSGVTNIGSWAFEGCASLTDLTIPANVTGIGNFAFSGCSSLAAVYFLGNAPDIGEHAFNQVPATIYYWPWTTGWGSTFGGLPTVRLSPPPSLPVQTNRVIYASGWLLVTNTLAASPLATQMITNAYSFGFNNRDELLADGWSFIATLPDGTARNTEITNPALGAVVSYDLAPGMLRIPCDVGDLYETGSYVNNTRNSLFRSLPTNWVTAQLRLTFAPAPTGNYQQVHFGLYQDDDNYLEVGSSYNSASGPMMDITIETAGLARARDGFPSPGTNFCFQLNRVNGAIAGSGSTDGVGWTSLGSFVTPFANPRLMIWTGSYQAPYTSSSPNCNLSDLTVVVSTNVPRTLNYRLVNPPAGARIDTNGIITWQPTPAQAMSTNLFMTVVTDNGMPPINLTNTFEVVVFGQPELAISPLAGGIGISCPGDLAGWLLQSTTNLGPGSIWQLVTDSPQSTNGQWTVTIQPPSDRLFYRLVRPF